MGKINGKEKPQGMSATKAEATAKTRRHKHSPKIEGWEDIPQVLLITPFQDTLCLKLFQGLKLNDKENGLE